MTKKGWYEDHILAPDADRRSVALQYDPTAKPFLGQIAEQKSKADLADKALATLRKSFPSISEQAGESSYARNHLEPFLNAVPFGIGAPLARATHTFTDNASTRSYEVDKASIKGAVRGALQGNVSDELLDSTIDANLPERNDSPEILDKKFKALNDFIRAHTKTDLLRRHHLSKE